MVETVCVKESHMQRSKMCTADTHSFCIGPLFLHLLFAYRLFTGAWWDFPLHWSIGSALCTRHSSLSMCLKHAHLQVFHYKSKPMTLISLAFDSLLNTYLNFPRSYKAIVFLLVITLGNGLTFPQGDWVGILSHSHCLYLFLYCYIWPPDFAISVL